MATYTAPSIVDAAAPAGPSIPPEEESTLTPRPSITSFQLIVSFHEDTYQTVFPNADLSDFKYHELRAISVTAERGQPPPPPAPPPHAPPPPQQQPPPPPLQPLQSLKSQEQQLLTLPLPQQQQHMPPSLPPPPSPQDGPWRHQYQRFNRQRAQQQPHGWHKGHGGGRGRAFQYLDEYLILHDYSNDTFKVNIDRRLRPVVLATHKTEDCPLPLLGLNKRHGTSTVGDATAGGHDDGGNGGCERRRRETHELQALQDALQKLMDLTFTEKFSAVGSVAIPAAGSRDDGGGCGEDGCDNCSSGSDDSGSDGGDAAPLLPPAPLIILANEGKWRESRVIHLKTPVGDAAEYVRLLRTQLARHGFVLTNHSNDTETIASVLRNYHSHLTAIFSTPTLQSIISNFSRLPEAQQLLKPNLFFPVLEVKDQLSGKLGAVWYGCQRLPQLVATLPGRPVNGLSLEEALDCMEALWGSELRKRLFGVPERETAGLRWMLVPCFA